MTDLNGTDPDDRGNIVIPWKSISVSRMEQDNLDGLFQYHAIIIEIPNGCIVLPITEKKQEQPPVGLQVKLQTSAKLMLEAINQIQLWDQDLTSDS